MPKVIKLQLSKDQILQYNQPSFVIKTEIKDFFLEDKEVISFRIKT